MHTAVCLCVCVCVCVRVCDECTHLHTFVSPWAPRRGVPRIKIIVAISIAPCHTDKGGYNALNLLSLLSVSNILDCYLLIIC